MIDSIQQAKQPKTISNSNHEQRQINAPNEAMYLGDLKHLMPYIPSNTLFDKGKTGCGGTEFEIRSQRNSIIAVPYQSLIINKGEQFPKTVIGVYGSYNSAIDDNIRQHLNDESIEYKKILVTYDSIGRVINAIDRYGVNGKKGSAFKDFFLLIDEYHILFTSYVLRDLAIGNLLGVYRNFSNTTFMSATPLEDEYLLEEIKHLPKTKIAWKNLNPIEITPIETNNPTMEVCEIVNSKLAGRFIGNPHFFINSVKMIIEVIKKCALKSSDVKIVCSNNVENAREVAALGEDYMISTDLLTPKLINFYTSTAFEGADIFDEQGKAFIVSHAYTDSTLIDISTLLVQISGRIRNSRYRGISHIYSLSYKNKLTLPLDEFKLGLQFKIGRSIEYANYFNKRPIEYRLMLYQKCTDPDKGYLTFDTLANSFSVDLNVFKLELFDFKRTNQIYSRRKNLFDEYKKQGFLIGKIVHGVYLYNTKQNRKRKLSFKELFEDYAKLLEDKVLDSGTRLERIQLLETKNEYIKKAYDKIGPLEVRRMKYNLTNIKVKLIKKNSDSKKVEIMKQVRNILPLHIPIPRSEVKKTLKEAYNATNIAKKPKSTDIEEYYEVEPRITRINGTPTNCIILKNEKPFGSQC